MFYILLNCGLFFIAGYKNSNFEFIIYIFSIIFDFNYFSTFLSNYYDRINIKYVKNNSIQHNTDRYTV